MKLKYISEPNSLGGTAVPDCGTIHRSEIKDTLLDLSHDLGTPFDFNDYTLGSTGKRDYSGDIDVVVDSKWWTDGIPAFRQKLEEKFGKENVARNGDMLHLKYPINGYNSWHCRALPRTGFVQIDFNFGDVDWERFYHYSDANSEYKGAHRNLMISAICAELNTAIDFEDAPTLVRWDDEIIPTSIIRWKWGSNGFIRVHRKSVKDKHGHWSRKHEDTVLDGPFYSPMVMAHILFPKTPGTNCFNSLETLITAVKKNYGIVECERVWRRAAKNFSEWNQGKLFEYPPEISAYFLSKDK